MMKTIYDKLVEKNMLNVLDNWDYEKNGNPKTTPYHSTLRVSLICKKCGYRYETRIDHVLEGRKCIKCASKERSLKRTKKLIENGNTLSNLFPSLVEEWDYEKNNPLTPDDITAKSPKKIWWKCANGHSWYASPNTRITNNVISKCPYCCGSIAIKGENDFGTFFPNLLNEWDFKKNGDLDPHSLKVQSNKKVWWKCANGHSWKQVIATRTKFNTICPVCSGKNSQEAILDETTNRTQINFKNYITICRNDLLSYWSSKNKEELKNISVNDTTKYYWAFNGKEIICSIGAMLEIIDKNETNKLAIGFNDLKTIHPELLNEWDYGKNDENPSDFKSGSNLTVWWRCERGHSWKARIINRVKGNGCPQCKRELHTSFPEQAILFYLGQICDVESRYLIDGREADIFIKSKKVAIEYNGYFFHGKAKKATRDEEKEKYFNDKGILLVKVIDTREPIKTYVENNEIHCHMDQKYSALKEVISFICSIIQTSCPPINIENDYQLIMKQYFQLAKKGSLAERNPKLAAEWHPTKNGDLKPDQFLVSSSKYVWWLGPCGHEWQAKISNRNRGKGCPICNQYVVTSGNNLAILYPEIAAEWHPTKNGDLKPTDVLPGSNKKAWWLDKEGNEWETKICVRVRYKTGAPQLKGKTISETKLRLRLEKEGPLAKNCPQILKYWDYSKNSELDPNRLLIGSHQKVFLKCPICGYEFSKEIRHEIQKIKTGHPCPNCDKNIKGSTSSIN